MRKFVLATTACVILLFGTGTAKADTVTVNFTAYYQIGGVPLSSTYYGTDISWFVDPNGPYGTFSGWVVRNGGYYIHMSGTWELINGVGPELVIAGTYGSVNFEGLLNGTDFDGGHSESGGGSMVGTITFNPP